MVTSLRVLRAKGLIEVALSIFPGRLHEDQLLKTEGVFLWRRV